MNLFYLDEDIDKCAEAHIDKHVTKMQLELGQMLSTNLWIDEVLGYTPRKVTSDETALLKSAAADANYPTTVRYKPYFFNHPCTIWMRESYEHWEYSWLLVLALDSEAQWRGYAPHKSAAMVRQLPFPAKMERAGFYRPALAMPDECKRDDAVEAYRTYYRNVKYEIASYTKRMPPEWWWKNPASSKNYAEAIEVYEKAAMSKAKDAKDVMLQFQKMAQQILVEGRA